MGEIQSKSDPSQWRHVPGELNVADDLSRGISVKELSGRWSNGPEFLRQPEEQWPPKDAAQPPQEEHMERLRVEAAFQATATENPIDPQTISSWRRLIRVTARIRRLAEKIRLRKHEQDGKEGPLTPEELGKEGIHWIFTTPAAPHQNECAEALFKSCKSALKKVIGEQVMTPFELYTCLLEVGNLVNQRPIGRIPNDQDDGAYLCPNDMLLGRATSEVPQSPFNDTKNPRHRVEFVQRIVDSFWKRWNRDVFPALVPQRKWHVEKRNVQVNDVVTMADSNAIRGKWTIGRVLKVYPGLD